MKMESTKLKKVYGKQHARSSTHFPNVWTVRRSVFGAKAWAAVVQVAPDG